MKKIINSMLMLAMAAMTFVSCEDVPEPYSWPTPPDTGNEEEVITPQGSGTLEDPYNVAAAQALIQTLGADVQSEEIYVKGFISQIDDISPVPETTYGNATYWISDQKGSTAGQLEIYRGYSLGGEKFTSKDEIKEDDEVIVFGKVVNFRGSTPEFTTGSSIYSLNGKKAEGGGNTQPGDEIKKVTIAEFNAAAESNDVWYELTGTVKNLKDGDQYGNFDLEDETGSVYVYGLLAEKGGEKKMFQELVAAKGIKEGSKITIIGTRGSYNEKIEVLNAYFVSIESGNTPSGKGSVSDPYSVPEALAAINALEDGGYSATEVYVKGKVVKVTTNQANFEKYGNLNYLISENGEDANTITVYSGDGLKGEKFSGIDALKPGDEVIVYGKLQKYVKNGNVTPEIAKGNYLYSLNGKTEPGGGGGETTGTGTLENPLTATQAYDAVAAMEGGAVSESDYYVKGKISSIKYTFSAEYGTATFNISDDGTDSGKQFIAYSCYYFGNKKWEEGNKQVNVGDEVIVCGKVVNYNGNTPEFASKKNYLVSLNGSSSSKRR